MSSNIRVQRICQHCGQEFTARTTVTKYCSDKCSKAAYKARILSEKVQKANAETIRIKNQPIEQLKAKEFLSINEVCQLIGVSRRTVYRQIEQGALNKIKVGSRTLIKRTALDKLLIIAESGKPEIPEEQKKPLHDWQKAGAFDFADWYTIGEILERYSISDKALQNLIEREGISKVIQGRYSYVPKPPIDRLLS